MYRPQIRHLMFANALTNAIIDTLSDLEQAVTAAVCSTPPASGCGGLLQRLFSWVPPGLPQLLGKDQVVHYYQTLCCSLPQQLRQGWSGAQSRQPRLLAWLLLLCCSWLCWACLGLHRSYMTVGRACVLARDSCHPTVPGLCLYYRHLTAVE